MRKCRNLVDEKGEQRDEQVQKIGVEKVQKIDEKVQKFGWWEEDLGIWLSKKKKKLGIWIWNLGIFFVYKTWNGVVLKLFVGLGHQQTWANWEIQIHFKTNPSILNFNFLFLF